jgi:hypothetical protein
LNFNQYFNYMGMLAVEGTYDKMEALLNQGIHPVDILLMLAASEGDKPKIEELLRAGAKFDVKDVDGRTARPTTSGSSSSDSRRRRPERSYALFSLILVAVNFRFVSFLGLVERISREIQRLFAEVVSTVSCFVNALPSSVCEKYYSS